MRYEWSLIHLNSVVGSVSVTLPPRILSGCFFIVFGVLQPHLFTQGRGIILQADAKRAAPFFHPV